MSPCEACFSSLPLWSVSTRARARNRLRRRRPLRWPSRTPAASATAAPTNDGTDPKAPILSPDDADFVDARKGAGWGDRCFTEIKQGKWGWAHAACDRALALPDVDQKVRPLLLYNEGLIAKHAGDDAAAQWETQLDADFRKKHAEELRARLARPRVMGPPYWERCSECGTSGNHELHRASCSKYSAADEAAATAADCDETERDTAEEGLKSLQREPTWIPFPERSIGFDKNGPILEDVNASIEAGYQRYLAADGGRDAQRLCHACRAALPSDAKFCDACGARCPECSKCGTSNRQGAPFCKQCGAALGLA